MTDEQQLEKIMRHALKGVEPFPNFNPLWRMSEGKRMDAVLIVKALLKRYGSNDLGLPDGEALCKIEAFDSIFDNVVAELFGNGCEIEWIEV